MAQSGQNLLVAFREESAYNTAPGATGGTRFRLNPSQGLSMSRPSIQPGEIRADQLQPIGRLGSRSVGGQYQGDLSVDVGYDIIWEALMRSTWTAAFTILPADITSITIANQNQIVAASGSLITEGLKVGDVLRLTGTDTSANDNINLVVLSVTASTATVYGNGSASPLTNNAVADTGFTITVLKKLANAATPTKRTFYIEEYYQDIDESLVFGGCKWSTCTLRGTPDGMATVEFGAVGASQTRLQTASAPYYTTPTLGANPGLVFVDAQILLGGTALLTATAFDLSIDLNVATLPIIGGTVSPDVFDNTMEVSGSLSILRDDLSRIEAFDNETEFELQILLEEATGTPKKAISFFLPRIKFTSADAPLGDDGAMVETLPFVAGVRAAASGYDAGVMTISTET